ncbi:hypothetical protein F511_34192 [Dorcoceras hygrometricum]|uniref:Uncharacterized protein n=1 Tax=Dorcoceras hygrometricum TaxID=472368 RepID=A0A2Z7CL72_9LAMI|nr:hypothetical protein F511_34192 [Dorcoceras hygrometricum]
MRHPSINVRPVVAPASGATVRKTAQNNQPAIARSALPSSWPSSSNRAASARVEARRRAAIARPARKGLANEWPAAHDQRHNILQHLRKTARDQRRSIGRTLRVKRAAACAQAHGRSCTSARVRPRANY